jgi:hypothetical protein
MKVRIESDGSPTGTRVVDQSGNDISNRVTGVTFRHNAGEVPWVELDLGFIEISAVETKARMIGPGGKEVRRIEYADGSEDVFSADD